MLLGIYPWFINAQESTTETPEKVAFEENIDGQKNKETNNKLYPKQFKKDFINKYQTIDFDYTLTKPHESIWQKIKRKVGEWLSKIFKDAEINTWNTSLKSILNFLSFIIVSGILFFLIRFLFGKEGNWVFSKKNKKIPLKTRPITENIHELNFVELIGDNEQKQDFRLAVRYQFLQLLKKLTDTKRIEWSPKKTNNDYLKELKNDTLYNNFESLAYIFDNVWYGEFLVSEEKYKQIKQQFVTAKEQL